MSLIHLRQSRLWAAILRNRRPIKKGPSPIRFSDSVAGSVAAVAVVVVVLAAGSSGL